MGTKQHRVGGRILLALQYWEGDKARAGELARFIASIEPTKRVDADFLLSARFDCSHDPSVVEVVGSRFDVFTSIGTTKLTGYPDGSFGLWHDTLDAASKLGRSYDCILTFEADCTPLVRDWVPRLLDVWASEAAPEDRIAIGQRWGPPDIAYPHINGNMLVSGKREHLEKLLGWTATPRVAWDVGIYPLLRSNRATGTGAISSFYVRHAHDKWYDYVKHQGAAFFHGDKDGSAQAFMKHVFTGSPKPKLGRGVVAAEPLVSDCNALGAEQSGGVWRYEDTYPATSNQGFSSRRVSFPDENLRRFNPGLVEWDGKLLMAYRAFDRRHDSQGIWMTVLDRDTYAAGESRRVNLPMITDGRPSMVEDPRLFRWGEKLMMAYTLSTYFPQLTCVQKLAQIDPDTLETVEEVPLPFAGNTGRPKSLEKNWQFFVDGGRLKVVYSLGPHVVYDVASGRRSFANITPFGRWQESWGTARGGTPPVEVDGRWYSFFHSAVKHPQRKRRYFAGAYSFRRDGDGYAPRDASQSPLLIASKRDGFQWPEGSTFWEPIVVFPSGAVFDRSRETWVVASGINDCFCTVFEIPHKELLKNF